VGNAAVFNSATDGKVLRITPDALWQNGGFYSSNSLQLGSNATFSTTFQFRFTATGQPADGMAFVLAAAPNGLGGSGAGMGYQGVPNSVAIEFDTYNNGGGDNNCLMSHSHRIEEKPVPIYDCMIRVSYKNLRAAYVDHGDGIRKLQV
jgi:hypothetical protein